MPSLEICSLQAAVILCDGRLVMKACWPLLQTCRYADVPVQPGSVVDGKQALLGAPKLAYWSDSAGRGQQHIGLFHSGAT